MKRSFKSYVICWAVLLTIYNVVCFVTPGSVTYDGMVYTKLDANFWLAYIFVLLSFAGQLLCARSAFSAPDARRFFYRVPVVTISFTGVILTMIFGTVVMAIPNLPNWIGSILCLLVLLLNIVAVIKADTAAELVDQLDSNISERTSFIRSMTAEAEGLMNRARSPEAKAACKRVYEALRYSDPMSSEALRTEEARITVKIDELAKALDGGSGDKAGAAADELVLLIKERNAKCKALK